MLRAPDVPSVLVELGYMSTKDDLEPSHFGRLAGAQCRALSQAIDEFFAPRLVAGRGIAAMTHLGRTQARSYRPQFQHKTTRPKPHCRNSGKGGEPVSAVEFRPAAALLGAGRPEGGTDCS